MSIVEKTGSARRTLPMPAQVRDTVPGRTRRLRVRTPALGLAVGLGVLAFALFLSRAGHGEAFMSNNGVFVLGLVAASFAAASRPALCRAGCSASPCWPGWSRRRIDRALTGG